MRLVASVLLAFIVGGCQVYLAGGPSGEPAPGAVRAPGPVYPDGPTEHEQVYEYRPPADVAPVPPAPAVPHAAPPRATFPGERYFAAGAPRTALIAAEDVLTGSDYRIVRSGVYARGGEVQAQRKERTDLYPRTTSSPASQVTAATIRIAGTDASDCCYVTAAFTTSSLNSAGNVLGMTHADDPQNAAIRSWFFDALAARLAPAAR
jgi:hypothetical protein